MHSQVAILGSWDTHRANLKFHLWQNSSGLYMSLAVDWNTALASVNGDRRLLKLVIDAFITESVQLRNQISTAIVNEDAELLHRSGHTFKGTMLTLGAEHWSHTAFRLEKLGSNGTTAGAQSIADELTQHLPSLLEQLRTFSVELK